MARRYDGRAGSCYMALLSWLVELLGSISLPPFEFVEGSSCAITRMKRVNEVTIALLGPGQLALLQRAEATRLFET